MNSELINGVCFYVIIMLLFFHRIRFPGKNPQNSDADSKTVTVAKRSRKGNTVEEILGESLIQSLITNN